MNELQIRAIGAGVFFIFIFLSGFWLSRSKKPYNTLKLNLHKLISLAAGIYLGVVIVQVHQVTPLGAIEIGAVAVNLLFFVITVVSGGLSSIDRPMPAAIAKIHKVLPYLATLFTAVTLYLILSHSIM